MAQDSGHQVTRARAGATPSLADRRAEIARTRGRLSEALAAVEQRVAGALERVKGGECPEAAPAGVAGLVKAAFTLAMRARRLRRALPVRTPVAVGVIAAGVAALGWLRSRRRGSSLRA